MTLWDAPFSRPLRIVDLSGLPEEARRVLSQLGLDDGEMVEKRHVAPLGDPISVLIGSQSFTLRSEICQKVGVEAL